MYEKIASLLDTLELLTQDKGILRKLDLVPIFLKRNKMKDAIESLRAVGNFVKSLGTDDIYVGFNKEIAGIIAQLENGGMEAGLKDLPPPIADITNEVELFVLPPFIPSDEKIEIKDASVSRSKAKEGKFEEKKAIVFIYDKDSALIVQNSGQVILISNNGEYMVGQVFSTIIEKKLESLNELDSIKQSKSSLIEFPEYTQLNEEIIMEVLMDSETKVRYANYDPKIILDYVNGLILSNNLPDIRTSLPVLMALMDEGRFACLKCGKIILKSESDFECPYCGTKYVWDKWHIQVLAKGLTEEESKEKPSKSKKSKAKESKDLKEKKEEEDRIAGLIAKLKALKIGETIYLRSDRTIDRLGENLYEYNDQGLYYRQMDLENTIKFLKGEDYKVIKEYEQEFNEEGEAIYPDDINLTKRKRIINIIRKLNFKIIKHNLKGIKIGDIKLNFVHSSPDMPPTKKAELTAEDLIYIKENQEAFDELYEEMIEQSVRIWQQYKVDIVRLPRLENGKIKGEDDPLDEDDLEGLEDSLEYESEYFVFDDEEYSGDYKEEGELLIAVKKATIRELKEQQNKEKAIKNKKSGKKTQIIHDSEPPTEPLPPQVPTEPKPKRNPPKIPRPEMSKTSKSEEGDDSEEEKGEESNEAILKCFECQKVVSLEEVREVEHWIEETPESIAELYADNYVHITGPKNLFHDGGAMNLCKADFFSLFEQFILEQEDEDAEQQRDRARDALEFIWTIEKARPSSFLSILEKATLLKIVNLAQMETKIKKIKSLTKEKIMEQLEPEIQKRHDNYIAGKEQDISTKGKQSKKNCPHNLIEATREEEAEVKYELNKDNGYVETEDEIIDSSVVSVKCKKCGKNLGSDFLDKNTEPKISE
jgi:uncharacterized Zn finger protein (UPF0148 family)